jgi:tRNA-modifying protein YgfZ
VTAGATAPLAVSGACDLVWVDGPDAASFLQGLLTNDVAGLEAGGSCPALLLDNKGHIRGAMRVARTGPEAFTLVAARGDGDGIVALLDEYHFSEDVDIIGPEAFAAVTVAGALDATVTGADLVLPGEVPGTTDAIGVDAAGILAAVGGAAGTPEELEVLRIEAGVPRVGIDVGPANLVQEAGLEATTVSFDKGCYLGQETVARVAYRGRVNRRLRGLTLPGPITPGAAVRLAGREVGVVTSSAVSPRFGAIALAMIRAEAEAGAAVDVDGLEGTAAVVELPFTKPLQSPQ